MWHEQSREEQNFHRHKSSFVWGTRGLEGYAKKLLKIVLGLEKGGRRLGHGLPFVSFLWLLALLIRAGLLPTSPSTQGRNGH